MYIILFIIGLIKLDLLLVYFAISGPNFWYTFSRWIGVTENQIWAFWDTNWQSYNITKSKKVVKKW